MDDAGDNHTKTMLNDGYAAETKRAFGTLLRRSSFLPPFFFLASTVLTTVSLRVRVSGRSIPTTDHA